MVKDIEIIDDIVIVDGDLKIIESDQQHIEHILRANPGHFYQHPTLGIGVDDNKLGSINPQVLKQQIQQNLEADNYRINKIEILTNVDGFAASIDAERLK